jgi:ribosomal protein S18 acetylase RimI-like enzyme
MLLVDHFPPQLPASLADRFTTRVPVDADVRAVSDLLTAESRRFDPEARGDEEGIRTRLVGLKSWSRRQVVVVPVAPAPPASSLGASPSAPTPSQDQPPIAWICLEDRAAGRANVQWAIAEDAPDREELAASLFAWAVEVGGSFARHRGLPSSKLTAGIDERNQDGARLLTAAGYEMVRTWLHMRRPVGSQEAQSTPDPRPGVRVRPVYRHQSGLPVAQDVRTVHRMLEESFADHFSSYRESFAEFVQRLTESPEEARWDHWWIAEVERTPGSRLPAGGLVAAPIPARPAYDGMSARGEGTYLEYLGVHRSARGHGVAKALLNAAIRDAAERGRAFVDLEVDADSPTHANAIYSSMGWETYERTQSWHAEAPAHPSRLLEPPTQ